jgi:aspartyl/asparaginyl beta-hydroxylase (cupin superfamily)
LKSDYFYTPDEVNPRLKGLQQIYPTLKKEWDSFHYGLEWKDFTAYQEKTIRESKQGHEIEYDQYFNAPLATEESTWSIAPLFFKHTPYTRNVEVLPKMAKTMMWLGETMYVGIARLRPSEQLGWHYDPDPNTHTQRLRCQLPLTAEICTLSVKDEYRSQAEGKLIIFQSSAMHKVENMGRFDRFSLIFDVFREGPGIL